ncbi:double-stranded RNA-specific adenosine deaminase-like isoform X2 [Argopecten irradians]|uniref:double-stranded RNA-specific adenosine deaminase-like isoform X2 n=1 Tax=Argopecten irradians TaxID=31199 RepID=UPI00371A5427
MAAKASLDLCQSKQSKGLMWPGVMTPIILNAEECRTGHQPVTCLHNFAQKYGLPLSFQFNEDSGPGREITFTCRARKGKTRYSSASAKSKQEAKREACKHVLKTLNDHTLHETPINQNGEVCRTGNEPITCLHNFAQKYGLPLSFQFDEDSGRGHEITFTCRAMIGKTIYPSASAKLKQEAKREACRHALRTLNGHTLYDVKPKLSTNGEVYRTGNEPITCLNNFAQKYGLPLSFQFDEDSDQSNEITFTCRAMIGKTTYPSASGTLKQEAKREACRHVLRTLNDHTLHGLKPRLSTNAEVCRTGNEPITCLHNFAQKYGLPLSFQFNEDSGPGNEITFTCRAMIGKATYHLASAKLKKEAKREACRHVLRTLNYHKLYEVKPRISTSIEICTLHDIIAKLCHEKFETVIADIPNDLTNWKVIAGIVMESKSDRIFEVISLASGSRFITGKLLTTNGQVVVDSHAEILAARGMKRFLYHQIQKVIQGHRSNVLQLVQTGKLVLVSGVMFHLYISTAPCGDGALFTRSSGESSEDHFDHIPIFGKTKQGLLRTKIENGEGQPPTKHLQGSCFYQSMEAIRLGKRLRVMSCSDKICKWNLLGVQGALLANLMEPVYLTSITLGSLYNHKHMARAMCCRLDRNHTLGNLPFGYKVNHPVLGCVSHAKFPERNVTVKKSNSRSINWNTEDNCSELTDGMTGILQHNVLNSTSCQQRRTSRLCKQEMMKFFINISSDLGIRGIVKDDYVATKKASTQYQSCKNILYTTLHNQGYKTWLGIPMECQEMAT